MLAASAALCALPLTVDAPPLVVAGFKFEAGEQAFADDALVISGAVTGTTDEQVRSTLVGSHLGNSIRVITTDVAVIEVAFSDNLIWNGDGNDFVILELSGSATPLGFGFLMGIGLASLAIVKRRMPCIVGERTLALVPTEM
ncbi:MAG TPA: hypothetical protein VMS55_16680 [Myxococcota bacterium]|nr:hypothetical protein [Myxococcota bacterium]